MCKYRSWEVNSLQKLIGQDIGGYRLTDFIGSGERTKVFKADHPLLTHAVGLKLFSKKYSIPDAAFSQRLAQEVKTIASLTYEHIVPVYDYGEDDDYIFLAMQYIRGATLKDVLSQNKRGLPLSVVLRIVEHVAQALDYLHEHQIVHGGAKPFEHLD